MQLVGCVVAQVTHISKLTDYVTLEYNGIKAVIKPTDEQTYAVGYRVKASIFLFYNLFEILALKF